jgi:hypothetical protein
MPVLSGSRAEEEVPGELLAGARCAVRWVVDEVLPATGVAVVRVVVTVVVRAGG